MIDSSESVGPDNFEIIKDFVAALVDRLTVGRNATRVGLVLYSLEVQLEFNLARYMTKQDVKQAIRRVNYIGEGTYTGSAIRKATQGAFYSARPGVRKVAIVITDGQTDKREPVKLEIAVREAHAANIEMYALGIINISDPTQKEFLQELNLIASDPDSEHMFYIDDFNTLPGNRFGKPEAECTLLQYECTFWWCTMHSWIHMNEWLYCHSTKLNAILWVHSVTKRDKKNLI